MRGRTSLRGRAGWKHRVRLGGTPYRLHFARIPNSDFKAKSGNLRACRAVTWGTVWGTSILPMIYNRGLDGLPLRQLSELIQIIFHTVFFCPHFRGFAELARPEPAQNVAEPRPYARVSQSPFSEVGKCFWDLSRARPEDPTAGAVRPRMARCASRS